MVAARGGTCVMVSLNAVGLAGFGALRRHATLPIHAHRNGWGLLGRPADSGWSYPAWAQLWRVAGADHMHVNGLANKFWEPDESVIASARACLTPLHPRHPNRVMPVFSSGQTVLQAAATHAALGSSDLIYCAGGGVAAHPDGPAAGVHSLRAAWRAAMDGVPLTEAARSNPWLAAAIRRFS
jgi:ribulose-bisphosphate carboxylase large chain